MGARGRKSVASLSVVMPLKTGRPPPPDDMPEPEATTWRAVVSTETAGLFKTQALKLLLVDFCRHIVTANLLTKLAAEFEPAWIAADGGLERLERLLKMRDRESRAAADKATKLRLTNQARYTPGAAATSARGAGDGNRPWDGAGFMGETQKHG
jgi:hypothetical protein